jgi:hypothetical protein
MATFRNQATLSYNGSSTTSNVVVGEITQVLSAAKYAPVDRYQTGDQLTFVVSITNSGTTPFGALTVTDNLGAYPFGTETRTPLTYVVGSVALYQNGVLQEDPAVTAGPPLVVSGIAVPAGGNVVLIYQARVNEFADPSGEGTITNTATVTGIGLSAPIEISETVSGESAVLLSITKAVAPVPVAENGRLTYTFVIENYGTRPAVATDNLIVTDSFDPVLTDLAVTFNGAAWTAPAQYTYDEATGLFATAEGQITVPAATVTRDPVTGAFTTVPGVATLVVTGTV